MAEDIAVAAQAAYEAYSEAVGGRDPYQHPMEPYDQLHDLYKQAWTAAAQAALGVGVAALPPAQTAPARSAARPESAATPATTKEDAEDDESGPGGRRRR